MKKILLILAIVSLGLGLSAQLVDRIVAKVGSDIILMSDVYKLMYQMQMSGVQDEDFNENAALRHLVEQKVIFQKAKEMDLRIDNSKVEQYAKTEIAKTKDKYPSEQAFAADLARENLTELELLDLYISQIRESYLTQQLVDIYVQSKVNISEDEMLEFYENSKDSLAVKPVTWETAYIIREIKPGKASEEKKLEEIRAILDRLNRGADFASLASETSDCPSSEQGGDLGFFSRGMMVKPFEDAAFKLNAGEVSGIVRSDYGFHIIKVEEKRANEIRARHILKILEPSEQDAEEAFELMEDIRERYNSGQESFEELAREYSEDTISGPKGGVIGELSQEEMPELYMAQIMATPVGKMTPVLENEGMLLVFARLQELPDRVFSYEEVKSSLKNYLYQEKFSEVYDEWIEELISKSFVEIVQ
ncbi:MAG: peptidylprolyl isomerase [Candidatus Cloacimonetes bacterium]|nr:peptidylprolyl isomerase [Candidatus Cloacimonadota bacterium]